MPVTNYIYDGNQYLAEADETDTINRVFINEPDAYTHLISQEDVSTGDSLYYHFDAIGSTQGGPTSPFGTGRVALATR